jgi:hypothetical protein
VSDKYPQFQLLSTKDGEHLIIIKPAEDEPWDKFARVYLEWGGVCQTQMLIDHLNITAYDPTCHRWYDINNK